MCEIEHNRGRIGSFEYGHCQFNATPCVVFSFRYGWALYQSYLDRDLGWEDRIFKLLCVFYFVHAHKIYVTRRDGSNWRDNGIVSEVEYRDIRWMLVALILSLVYYIVEGLDVPWQPWEFGSQWCEDYFAAIRTLYLGAELDLIDVLRNLKRVVVKLFDRHVHTQVKDAPRHNENEGELLGRKGNGVDCREISITQVPLYSSLLPN